MSGIKYSENIYMSFVDTSEVQTVTSMPKNTKKIVKREDKPPVPEKTKNETIDYTTAKAWKSDTEIQELTTVSMNSTRSVTETVAGNIIRML